MTLSEAFARAGELSRRECLKVQRLVTYRKACACADMSTLKSAHFAKINRFRLPETIKLRQYTQSAKLSLLPAIRTVESWPLGVTVYSPRCAMCHLCTGSGMAFGCWLTWGFRWITYRAHVCRGLSRSETYISTHLPWPVRIFHPMAGWGGRGEPFHRVETPGQMWFGGIFVVPPCEAIRPLTYHCPL